MNHKRFLGAASAALMIVIIVTLVLAPCAWAAGKYKTLALGGRPDATLTFDQEGNLYSTTMEGGAAGRGSVFKLTPNADGSWSESVLYSFCSLTYCQDGADPLDGAALIFDQAGNLYGATFAGGAYGVAYGGGTVFKLAPNPDGSWAESVLYSFCSLTNCADGVFPYGDLIFDAAGNLYGTTVERGPCCSCWDGGLVFKLAPNADGSWTESVLHSFCSLRKWRDGRQPYAGLIFDQAGNLYSTTRWGGIPGSCGGYGCGLVFKLAPNADGSWTESVLHQFTGGKDGGNPVFADLILDATGNLYGTTPFGGAYGKGVAFELTPSLDGSWKEKVLHQFTGGKDGGYVLAGLIFDRAGNLYGTTGDGGAPDGCGVVFKLTPTSSGPWKEKVLHTFKNKPGCFSEGALIFDSAGNLYGTTAGDGSKTFGSVFEITP